MKIDNFMRIKRKNYKQTKLMRTRNGREISKTNQQTTEFL